MTVFNKEYAGAYDDLYKDKNYERECDVMESIFGKFRGIPRTILDLGCGTGGHAIIFAERGYKVVGIDRSSAMLKIARTKAKSYGLKIYFAEGDITKPI